MIALHLADRSRRTAARAILPLVVSLLSVLACLAAVGVPLSYPNLFELSAVRRPLPSPRFRAPRVRDRGRLVRRGVLGVQRPVGGGGAGIGMATHLITALAVVALEADILPVPRAAAGK